MNSLPPIGDLFTPLSPLLAQIPLRPDLTALDFLNASRELRTRSGQRVVFVPPVADGLSYEARVWQKGEVATRPDNWHDFFNALVWLTFPAAKAALNARHAEERRGENGQRGQARDAMTHFDECGAIVVASDPSLLALLRTFAWKTLFWERRDDLCRHLRCFIFGHATYEQLLRPFRGMTAKAVLHQVSPQWLAQPLAEQLGQLDQRLAAELSAGAHDQPRAFQPLPLLGLPGVTPDNENATYYDDPWQFRAGRSGSRV